MIISEVSCCFKCREYALSIAVMISAHTSACSSSRLSFSGLFVKTMPPSFIESGRKLMENQWGHWFDEGLQPGFQMKIFRRGEQPLFVWRKPLYLEPS